MVPRLAGNGRSFKGLVLEYLMHDPEHAETSERVAWTHTLNLANDSVEHAVAEMIGTARHAEILKREAGIHRGGSVVEKPVKHLSLNWSPDEKVDQAEMIRATTEFLKHMGWQDHQAVLVAHQDKAHQHVHVVINQIHPEFGTKLDDGFEQRRAQKWALQYELDRGMVYCTERLSDIGQRAPAMSRPAWEMVRNAAEQETAAEAKRGPLTHDYMDSVKNRRVIESEEWQLLKERQRDERQSFFGEGKALYGAANRAVYKEVRENFRTEWAEYFAAKRDGMEIGALQEIRGGIVARQEAMFAELRDAVCGELRAERDKVYRGLLDAQKDERGELVGRQELGLRSPHLLNTLSEEVVSPVPSGVSNSLEDALDRFNVRRGRNQDDRSEDREVARQPSRNDDGLPDGSSDERPGRNSRRSYDSPIAPPSRDLGMGLAGGLLSLLGSVGESIVGGHTRLSRTGTVREDALERFQVRRGRTPDAHDERVKKEKSEREEWDAYKEKKELDRSRSGW